MAKMYSHIPAVGQLDAMACWAACMKWYLKAVRSVNKTQRSIIDKYIGLTDEYGAMQPDEIIQVIVDNDMYIEVHDRASDFTAQVVAQRLTYSPLYVAYTESSTQTKHVNIIYSLIDSGSNPRVRVMEPQFKVNDDLSWRGAHQIKPLSEFNRFGSVYFGYE